jgi:serine/threonine-protein kinase HipA
VDGRYKYETFQKLSSILLMTFALKNADCHSKNLALLYTSRKDARLAPVYDFFTTQSSKAFEGISDPPRLENSKTVIGRSELLARPRKHD